MRTGQKQEKHDLSGPERASARKSSGKARTAPDRAPKPSEMFAGAPIRVFSPGRRGAEN